MSLSKESYLREKEIKSVREAYDLICFSFGNELNLSNDENFSFYLREKRKEAEL